MEFPNKIYVCEYKGKNQFDADCHFVITVAGSSEELVREHVKEKIGFDSSPVWLMNAVYPTIYVSSGRIPEPKQVKILSNCNFHTDGKFKTKLKS